MCDAPSVDESSLAGESLLYDPHLPKTSQARAASGGVCDGAVSAGMGEPPVLGSTRDNRSEEETTRGRDSMPGTHSRSPSGTVDDQHWLESDEGFAAPPDFARPC
jgi:hypothetical protein